VILRAVAAWRPRRPTIPTRRHTRRRKDDHVLRFWAYGDRNIRARARGALVVAVDWNPDCEFFVAFILARIV